MTQQRNSSLERFLTRLQQATRSKSREVVFSLDEANELHMALSAMLVRQNTLLEELVEAQRRASQPQTIQLDMDGGSF